MAQRHDVHKFAVYSGEEHLPPTLEVYSQREWMFCPMPNNLQSEMSGQVDSYEYHTTHPPKFWVEDVSVVS
jgi:hypothetical protein